MANLHVAYHYLKQQEKNKGITLPLESKRGKMRIRLDEPECDLLRFDELYTISRDQNQPLSERIDEMEKALTLYRGGLLADRGYEWSLPLQQGYEIKYEEILKTVIAYYENSSDLKKKQYYTDCLHSFLE